MLCGFCPEFFTTLIYIDDYRTPPSHSSTGGTQTAYLGFVFAFEIPQAEEVDYATPIRPQLVFLSVDARINPRRIVNSAGGAPPARRAASDAAPTGCRSAAPAYAERTDQ
jgi:hypothetical protein